MKFLEPLVEVWFKAQGDGKFVFCPGYSSRCYRIDEKTKGEAEVVIRKLYQVAFWIVLGSLFFKKTSTLVLLAMIGGIAAVVIWYVIKMRQLLRTAVLIEQEIVTAEQMRSIYRNFWFWFDLVWVILGFGTFILIAVGLISIAEETDSQQAYGSAGWLSIITFGSSALIVIYQLLRNPRLTLKNFHERSGSFVLAMARPFGRAGIIIVLMISIGFILLGTFMIAIDPREPTALTLGMGLLGVLGILLAIQELKVLSEFRRSGLNSETLGREVKSEHE